ncbi:hypothetical protein ACFX2I_004029 [Malus domestica]
MDSYCSTSQFWLMLPFNIFIIGAIYGALSYILVLCQGLPRDLARYFGDVHQQMDLQSDCQCRGLSQLESRVVRLTATLDNTRRAPGSRRLDPIAKDPAEVSSMQGIVQNETTVVSC